MKGSFVGWEWWIRDDVRGGGIGLQLPECSENGTLVGLGGGDVGEREKETGG